MQESIHGNDMSCDWMAEKPTAQGAKGETPLSFREAVMSELPLGGNLNACNACGACASGCPASGLSGMDPRQFVRLVSLGQDEALTASDWVWMCTTCGRCVNACPMGVDIPGLVLAARSHWPEKRKPRGLKVLCPGARGKDSGTVAAGENRARIVRKTAKDIRENMAGFGEFSVPVDKKGAGLFIGPDSGDPRETASLWKILHLAGADWTWTMENNPGTHCMHLGNTAAWEARLRACARRVDNLGCRVWVVPESGHDFMALIRGLERFDIPHGFEVKSVIGYYADWIRTGRLNLNSDWNLDRKLKFTLQYPCQLVGHDRGRRLAEDLRYVVKTAVGEENFIEMYPGGANTYCCGGGGGTLDTGFVGERLEYGRIKVGQILETGADYCITPCRDCRRQIWESGRFYHTGFTTVHLWTVLGMALKLAGQKA